jgi:hypothetical protein
MDEGSAYRLRRHPEAEGFLGGLWGEGFEVAAHHLNASISGGDPRIAGEDSSRFKDFLVFTERFIPGHELQSSRIIL